MEPPESPSDMYESCDESPRTTETTRIAPVSTDEQVLVTPVPPAPAPSSEKPAVPVPQGGTGNAGLKWLILIIFGLILIAAFVIVAYYVFDNDTRGVTVVRMEGTMATGDFSDAESIGSEVVGRELREAADDPMVEAIVLRVNSPGGTPAAAQEIIGDIEYAKSKKPVVVSMGDMATSAAYYVSAHADRIYANPDTFTAGVGVIWTFSDISRWMQNEGYNVSVIKSGAKKDMGSTSRPISSDEQAYAEKIVDSSFETFIADVMAERSILRSDIEDGRVIRGADAVKMNIVDELGNLNDAIDGAKRMAESRR